MRRKQRSPRNTTIVLGILALGLLGAIPFFRSAAPGSQAPRRPASDELALRGVPLHVSSQQHPSPAVGLQDEEPTSREASSPDGSPARFPRGLDQFGPPPEFTSTFPFSDDAQQKTPRTGSPPRSELVSVRPVSAESSLVDTDSPRRHRIVDGDTLTKLARKYLGDSARAGEIFEANRGLLVSHEILPLGVEIVIPAR